MKSMLLDEVSVRIHSFAGLVGTVPLTDKKQMPVSSVVFGRVHQFASMLFVPVLRDV